MGQIYLESTEQFDATNIDGSKFQMSLRGGNHTVSKLICLGGGLYDAVLESGVKIHNLDLDKVGRKIGKIKVEKSETPEIGQPGEKKNWFEGFGGSKIEE